MQGLGSARTADSTSAMRNRDATKEIHLPLEPGFQMWCTPIMAEEKSRSKDIILWIITVALVALAIFWYRR